MTTLNGIVNYGFDPDDCEMLYTGDTPKDVSTIAAMGVEGFWCVVGKAYHQGTRPWQLRRALAGERGMVRLAMEMFDMCMIEARHVEPVWRTCEPDGNDFMHVKNGEWFAVPEMPYEVEELCTCKTTTLQQDVENCAMKAWWKAERKAKALVNAHFGKDYIR